MLIATFTCTLTILTILTAMFDQTATSWIKLFMKAAVLSG